MSVNAIQAVKTNNVKGECKYPVKAINIIKRYKSALIDSQLIIGFALEEVLASDQMPKTIHAAKIAMIDFDLRKKPLKFGIQMIITDPDEIESMRRKEIEEVEKKCKLILQTKANVIFTTGTIDEIALQILVTKGIMGIRRVSKKKTSSYSKIDWWRTNDQFCRF
jgi:T-complex protein 1 subunit alpha